MSAFNEHVLAWLRAEGDRPEAASVESVSGNGYDMQGDTNSGFYSEFTVDIRYTDAAGKAQYRTVDGSDMESLWKSVVGGWGKQ